MSEQANSVVDATLLVNRYRHHLRRLRAEAQLPLDTPLNQLPGELRMRALAQVNLLKAKTGADVMAMLLSSERVYSDMLDWLWFGEPEQVRTAG